MILDIWVEIGNILAAVHSLCVLWQHPRHCWQSIGPSDMTVCIDGEREGGGGWVAGRGGGSGIAWVNAVASGTRLRCNACACCCTAAILGEVSKSSSEACASSWAELSDASAWYTFLFLPGVVSLGLLRLRMHVAMCCWAASTASSGTESGSRS